MPCTPCTTPGPCTCSRSWRSTSSARSTFLGRPLPLIAESDLNDPRLITAREGGGYGLTAQWSDDFHHALYVSLTGDTSGYYADFGSLDALGKVYTDGFFHTGTRSSFRQRSHGHPIDTFRTPTWRLVVCSDNHDQIGNRAAGERLSAKISPAQQGAGGPGHPAQPVHPDDLHGRGVGRDDPVAASSPPTRSRSWPSWSGRAGWRSSRRWPGTSARCRTPRTRRRSPPPSWTGPSSTAAAGGAAGADHPAAGDPPDLSRLHRPALRRRPGRVHDEAGWLLLERGAMITGGQLLRPARRRSRWSGSCPRCSPWVRPR